MVQKRKENNELEESLKQKLQENQDKLEKHSIFNEELTRLKKENDNLKSEVTLFKTENINLKSSKDEWQNNMQEISEKLTKSVWNFFFIFRIMISKYLKK